MLAAAVLEPIYESAGEWERVIAVYEVMAAHSEDAGRRRRAAAPHRRDRRAPAVAPERGVRRLRARAARRSDQPGHARRTSSGWPPRPGTGPSWRRCYAAELEKVDDPRRAGRHAAAPRARLRGGARPARGGDRDLPPRPRRPSPTTRRRWSRSIGCSARAQQWDELAEIVRARDPDRADRRGPHRAELPARADLRAGAGRHAQGRRGLPRDPDRRSDARRDARRAGADVPGRHDAARDRRRPRAALPRRRGVGEAAPDPRGAARPPDRRRASGRRCCAASAEIAEHKLVDQVAAFGWWAEAVNEDPSSEQALDELLRLARATHQWDAYVATMTEAPRRPSSTPRRAARRAAAAGRELRERARQPANAPRRRCLQVLSEHAKDPAALASLDRIYESQGMYENLAAILRQRIDDHRRHRRAGRAEPAPRARLRRGARATSSRRSPATSRCSSTSRARATRSRRSSGSTSAASAGRSCTASTRSWSTSPGRRAAWPTATRAWPSSPPTRSTTARRRSSCGAASSTSAARTPSRCRAWPICTRWPSEWNELVEVLEQQVVATPDPEAQIPIYKRLGRIWGEKLTRERNSLESWQKVLEIDPQDVDALRAHRRELQAAQALGGAVADAAPPDRGRPAGRQRHRARRAQGAVLAARRARGRDPDADAGGDRRLARGAGARRARLPRAGGARAAVHAGGALGGVHRHPRAAREGAGQPERPASTS